MLHCQLLLLYVYILYMHTQGHVKILLFQSHNRCCVASIYYSCK